MLLTLHIGFTLTGIWLMLIGWKVVKPTPAERWNATYEKWKGLFRWGGLGIAVVGALQVIEELVK